MSKEKYCTGCLYKKDFSEFSDRKSSKDGKRRICKPCAKLENAKTTARNKKKSDKAAKLRAACRAEDKKAAKIKPAEIKLRKCIACQTPKPLGKYTKDKDDSTHIVKSRSKFKSKPKENSRLNRICSDCNYKGREKAVIPSDDKAKIKAIFAVPVNVMKTQAYYMGHRYKQEQKEIRLR